MQPGGGKKIGPQPRSYEQATPKEKVRCALRSALSDRVKAGKLMVLDQIALATAKTKAFDAVLKNGLQLDKVLIVDDVNKNLELSGRNIPRVRVLRTEAINVYDIVRHDNLVLTKRAVEAITKRLAVQE